VSRRRLRRLPPVAAAAQFGVQALGAADPFVPSRPARAAGRGRGPFRKAGVGVGAVRGAELNMANVGLRQRANRCPGGSSARLPVAAGAGFLHQGVDDFLGAAAGPCRALPCCRAGRARVDRVSCATSFQSPAVSSVGRSSASSRLMSWWAGTGVAVGGSTRLSSRPDWAARQVAAASSSGRTGMGGRPAIAAPVSRMTSALGIESGHEAKDAKRWGQAVAEVRDKVLAAASEGADAAERFGAGTFDRATEVFRPVDIDGDGTPDQPRAAAAAQEAGAAIKGAAAGIAGAFGTLFQRKTAAPILTTTSSPSRTGTERPGHIDSGHARAPMAEDGRSSDALAFLIDPNV
jgi:hypothetical protein